jgi:zinc/manganese transport system substrate-binding protein
MCNGLRIREVTIGTLVMAAFFLAACSGADTSSDRRSVVVTTTILGDVAANVVGDDADVEVLIPIGASPHEFVPSSQQVATIYEADLVVANGLGLEEGLTDVLEAAAADGINVLEIAPHLDPLPLADGDELDPHVWMDPLRMQTAAAEIAGAMFLIDGDDAWQSRAEDYAAALQTAHEQIETMLSTVPSAQRKLVTNHDSLGYLADRYGFEIVGTVIPGGSSLGAPSSAALAELVALIEREQVPAIFAETTEPQALAEAVAAEAGSGVVVVELLTGSLAPKGRPGDTLIGMLLIDAERIAGALGS